MTGLALGHAQFALAPAQVVEGQCQDVTSAQAIGGDQQEDRVVAQAHGCGAIDGIEKCTHTVPRPGPRELLKPEDPRGVDVPVNSWTESPYGQNIQTHCSSTGYASIMIHAS